MDLSPSTGEGRETPILFGPLEKANISPVHQSLDQWLRLALRGTTEQVAPSPFTWR
jgi:hypothetical protein